MRLPVESGMLLHPSSTSPVASSETLFRRPVFACVLALGLAQLPLHGSRQESSANAHILPLPHELSVTADHQYRLAGAARPFMLFWIRRDDVGGGRMTWRRGANGTLSLELLMGSDPARAPFKANRWGYIREVIHGDTAELVAVKTEVEEETLEEAKASVTRAAARTLVLIRERVTPHEARAWSAVVDVGRDVTFRDVDLVLDRMTKVREWNERVFARPSGTRPGFLVALTELMRSGVEAWAAADASTVRYVPQTVLYIHRAKPYELRQSDVELLRGVTIGGRWYPRLLQGQFRMRNPTPTTRVVSRSSSALKGSWRPCPCGSRINRDGG